MSTSGWASANLPPTEPAGNPGSTNARKQSFSEPLDAADEERRALDRLISAQNEARAKYGPNPQSHQTFCNDATYCVVRDMGGPLGPLGNARGEPYLANRMAQELAISPDYRDVTPEEGQRLANEGQLVIGAWFNPAGHGHVVTVRPVGVAGDRPFGLRGPLLNDVGASDRVARQSGAFKAGDQVFYYTPAQRY